MKYTLLIYNRPGFAEEPTETEREELFGEVDAITKELQEPGEFIGGKALADPSATRNARLRNGELAVTDGPFLEAKEHFAGYLAVDCDSVERAVEIASRWPDVPGAALVPAGRLRNVRRELPGRARRLRRRARGVRGRAGRGVRRGMPRWHAPMAWAAPCDAPHGRAPIQ